MARLVTKGMARYHGLIKWVKHLLISLFLVNRYSMNNGIFTTATERHNTSTRTLQIKCWAEQRADLRVQTVSEGYANEEVACKSERIFASFIMPMEFIILMRQRSIS